MPVPTLSPSEFKQVLAAGNCTIVDVRTPAEFRELHLRGAVNVPLDRIAANNIPSPADSQPLYIVCQKGGRGAQACQKLTEAGVGNVVNIDGGTIACQAAGLPMIAGKKTMSIERQVRIAAGSLVVLGVALSWVQPAFLALPAFVGAGLVFAGVTDTCGMGMLLARMPWNQVGCCETSGTCQ